MRLPFVTVDVFTKTRFGGNPLAVVLDADALNQAQMQTIAQEFGLPETTFICKSKDIANDANVRIFTPTSEMPFAGHPNIGTAYVLASRSGQKKNKFVFEEHAGLVSIDIWYDDSTVIGAELRAPQKLTIGETVSVDLVATACGISPAEIDVTKHPPRVTSTGAKFITVQVRSTATLKKAKCSDDIFKQNWPLTFATGVHLYTCVNEMEHDVQARMFAPLHGIAEDPATGSATTNLIGLLALLSPEENLCLIKKISQGGEIGRPSLLVATAIKECNAVLETKVRGSCVPVMEGIIDI